MKDRLIAAAVSAAVGFSPTSGLATPQRTVAEQTVISQGDPAVEIKLPGSAEYVGMERFLLSKPTLGNTESCEQYAFVETDMSHQVGRFWWIQFEAYLPGHPHLHMTYDSQRHARIGGLDFYVDAGVASSAKPPRPGSDAAHFYSLLASHGYRRDDLMWVRLVHLLDTAKRKELMIIYAESLRSTAYSADELRKGRTEHAKWASMEDQLIHRAEQSIDIRPRSNSR